DALLNRPGKKKPAEPDVPPAFRMGTFSVFDLCRGLLNDPAGQLGINSPRLRIRSINGGREIGIVDVVVRSAQGNLGEQLRSQFLGQLFAAAAAEDVILLSAGGA